MQKLVNKPRYVKDFLFPRAQVSQHPESQSQSGRDKPLALTGKGPSLKTPTRVTPFDR